MSELEKLKIKAELMRVLSAKAEMEYMAAQRMEEVNRLRDNIQKQDDMANDLRLKLGE